MKEYIRDFPETQYGHVQFIFDQTNTGLTQVKVNGVEVKLPASVLKQTAATILRKLGKYLTSGK